MKRKAVPIIGVVGGVGSGKSAVARWLAEHHQGDLIDADLVGHQVLLQDDVKQNLRQAFGESVFDDGAIDRRRLAVLVFGDQPEQAAARVKLERIVHPPMAETIKSRITTAREDEKIRLIVFDAAILLESGWRDICDVVAFIDVPRDQRRKRIALSRGWTDEELTRRETSQWSLERKREASDVVIDNSGTIEQAGHQLEDYLFHQGWLTHGRRPTPSAADDQPSVLNRS